MSKETFDDLGPHFPLFSAPVETASEYIGTANCTECGTKFEILLDEYRNIPVCYGCLRAGRAALTKDTEFGMVTYWEAIKGQTHGVPGLETTMFDTLAVGEDDWIVAKIPRQHLMELMRTPSYHTWQGECSHQNFCPQYSW